MWEALGRALLTLTWQIVKDGSVRSAGPHRWWRIGGDLWQVTYCADGEMVVVAQDFPGADVRLASLIIAPLLAHRPN